MDILQKLIDFFVNYGYWAAFSILLLCGFGLPVPEDVTLVAGGVISGLGYADVKTMTLVCLLGVLVGDATMFCLGRIFGEKMLKWRIVSRFLTEERYHIVQEKFRKYGSYVMFVARFLPGLRSLLFMTAGITKKVSFARFLLLDGFAALISVPFWVYLGYYGANQRDWLLHQIKTGQYTILGLIGAALLGVLGYFYFKKKKATA